jgi:plastocyanin
VEGNVPGTTVERTEGATQMARLLGLALVMLALVVAGCGGDDDNGDEASPPPPPPPAATGGSGEATTLQNPADASGALAFQKESLTAPAGEITLAMENPSSVDHNIAVEGEGVDEEGEVVGEGGTSEVTATFEPGDYTFYCSVPGHQAAGMEGTLTVTG